MAINLREIKPHVVSSDLSGKSILLYGGPKTGKTTVACKFPKPILLAFEKGYNMIPGVMAQPINSWAEVLQAQRQLVSLMAEYESGKVDEPMFRTVVIDTADIAWDQCEKYTASTMNVGFLDETKWNKGYNRAKKFYESFFQTLARAGYAVVAISHSAIKVVKVKATGEEYERIQPSLEKRPLQILTGFVDLIAYADTEPQEDGTVKRILRMRGDKYLEAGSRNPYTSEVIPFTYEALVADMNQATEKIGETSGEEITAAPNNPYLETSTDTYEEVMDKVKTLAKTFRENGFADKYQATIENHLGPEKKAKDCTEGQIDVLRAIRDELESKIVELGLVPATNAA